MSAKKKYFEDIELKSHLKLLIMVKVSFILLMLFAFLSGQSQENSEWKEASKESQAYHNYRVENNVPSYGLKKIQTLITKIKSNDEDEEKLDQKLYSSLSLREKFTYHMIHAESYSQNCDAMPPIQNEHKKIFAQLPDAFGEYAWSDRQIKFFKGNKDSVIRFMEEAILKNNRIGVNFKQAIVEMNAKEMIPFMIQTYNGTKKDHDILTVLLLLMKQNEYQPFLISTSYKKLYGDEEASYQSYLNFNSANEELIIKRATDFYNGIQK